MSDRTEMNLEDMFEQLKKFLIKEELKRRIDKAIKENTK